MTQQTHHGSCLCKQVKFEIQGEFKGFFFCHCSRCRKITGTAYAANLFSKNATLTWLSGKEKIKSYHLTDTRFVTNFCLDCGSKLPSVEEQRLLVPAGSLDTDVSTEPTSHIFYESRANWDNNIELVCKHDALPPRN